VPGFHEGLRGGDLDVTIVRVRRRTVVRLAHVGWLLLAAACTEKIAAPGVCPEFCPSGKLQVIDTVLQTAVSGDSAFGRPIGYSNPQSALFLLAASLPGPRDSRPIFRTSAIVTRLPLSTDTTTSPVVGIDSVIVRLTITRRDTANHNLTVFLYKLPLTIDSTSTFAALVQPFTDSLIRSVNVDSLLAQPGYKNPVTGDSVLVDTTNQRVTLLVRVDSARVPLGTPDSGAVAFGVRVTAGASAAFAASENLGLGPLVNWYVRLDSLGIRAAHRVETRSPTFDSFVFDPPAAPLDANLTVGGVPAARTVMRLTFPRVITDSGQVIRATLELIPAVAAQGIAADSFGLVALPVVTDFGAKSPLDGTHADTTIVHIGSTDTVHVDVTNILRFWIGDTLAPRTIVLRQVPEGGNFAEIRFYPSSDAAHRPFLRLTYAPRFPFGQP
jgi:hypothetical protein